MRKREQETKEIKIYVDYFLYIKTRFKDKTFAVDKTFLI